MRMLTVAALLSCLLGCHNSSTAPGLPAGGEILSVSPGDLVPADPGDAFNFTAELEGNLQRIAWDFGDGVTPTTSTAQDPTVVAGPPGTYHGTVSAWFWPELRKISRPFTYRILQVDAAPSGLTITPTDSHLASHKTLRFRASVAAPEEVERWQWTFTGPVTAQLTTNSVAVVIADRAEPISATVTAANRKGDATQERTYQVTPSPHFAYKSRFAPTEKMNGYDELQIDPLAGEFFKRPLLTESSPGFPAEAIEEKSLDFLFRKLHPAGTPWSGTLRGCDAWACGDARSFDIPAPAPGTSLPWQSAEVDPANPFPNTTAFLVPYPSIAILNERVGIFFLGRDGYRFYRAKIAEPRQPSDWDQHVAISVEMELIPDHACHLGTLGDRWVIDTRGGLMPDHHGLLISNDATPDASSDWRPALRFRDGVGQRESVATAETPDGRCAILWARHEDEFSSDHFTMSVSGTDVFDDAGWTWINWDATTRLLDAAPQFVVAGDGLPMVFWIEQAPTRAVWSATAPAWDAPADDWEFDIIASRDRSTPAQLLAAASRDQIAVVWIDDRQNQDVLKRGSHSLVSRIPRPLAAADWLPVAAPVGAQPLDLAIAGTHLVLAAPHFRDGSYMAVTDSLAPATPSAWGVDPDIPTRFHAPGQQILIAGDSHLYAIGFSTHDPAPINRVFGPLVIDWIVIP